MNPTNLKQIINKFYFNLLFSTYILSYQSTFSTNEESVIWYKFRKYDIEIDIPITRYISKQKPSINIENTWLFEADLTENNEDLGSILIYVNIYEYIDEDKLINCNDFYKFNIELNKHAYILLNYNKCIYISEKIFYLEYLQREENQNVSHEFHADCYLGSDKYLRMGISYIGIGSKFTILNKFTCLNVITGGYLPVIKFNP